MTGLGWTAFLMFLQAANPPVPSQQTTEGAGSPIVTGNGNTITITCQDRRLLESIKALVTKVATKQLDPQVVNFKLDEILRNVYDIRASIAARRLSEQQMKALSLALTPFKGETITISTVESDVEAYRFAQDFVAGFRSAGINLAIYSVGADTSGVNQIMSGGRPPQGVDLYIRTPSVWQKPLTQALTRSLTNIGLVFSLQYGNLGPPRSDLEIVIGYKPTENGGGGTPHEPQDIYRLGFQYQNGHGVPQDYAKALGWFERAANLGLAEAMNAIGILYQSGQGVPQDYGKAREWFERAAAKGDAGGMNNLGHLYANGQGVPQDYGKAREWFERAAAKGNANAMYNLGMIYESGYGVQQDHKKARDWYEKADAAGMLEAKQRLQRLPQ